MNQYLIAIDMDGTVLNSEGKVTRRTARTLQRLLCEGQLLVPASGRALCLLPEEIKQLKGLSYAVLENGAMVWDYGKNAAVCKMPMQKGVVREILSDAQKLAKDAGGSRFYAEVFADGTAYAPAADVPLYSAAGIGGSFAEYMLHHHLYVESWEDGRVDGAEKVNLYFEDHAVSERLRNGWSGRDGVAVTTSVAGNAEFTAAGVNKGRGLSLLAERLGFPKERIIAFGDNENDLEMFEAAGVSVAMGNAAPHIREAARHVAPDNDHDGVCAALGRLGLIG